MSTHASPRTGPVFDVGVSARLPIKDSALMGLQNIFVMTGVFVFPAIMGKSFNMPPETVAYLYGVTFIGCGVTTLLMAGLFGRMPLVAGPYAGIFTSILAFAHEPGANLGTAFGSLAAASLAWSLLSIPIRGKSVVSMISKGVKNPAIAGLVVLLVMMQIADLAFPHWLGKANEPGFNGLNFGAGLVTALVLMFLSVSRVTLLKRLALLIGLVAGAAVYEVFQPINFAPVIHSPWFVAPRLFPFGIGFDLRFALVFFAIIVAINIQTLALMDVVAEWADEPMTPQRLSLGVLAMALGGAIGSCIGAFSNLPYPANVALLRATRVASRQVTLATGVLLIAMGLCTKLDYVFVVLPVPILGAAATVLFGIVFVHGVELLGTVEWNQRRLTAAGFALMAGFGTLFLNEKVLAKLPSLIGLLMHQPVIVGLSSFLILIGILPGRDRAAMIPAEVDATSPALDGIAPAEPA